MTSSAETGEIKGTDERADGRAECSEAGEHFQRRRRGRGGLEGELLNNGDRDNIARFTRWRVLTPARLRRGTALGAGVQLFLMTSSRGLMLLTVSAFC